MKPDTTSATTSKNKALFAGLLATAALVWPGNVSAEDQREERPFHQRTLLGGSGKMDHGGYGGLLARGSALNGDPALFVGGRGGWLIGHHLLIGASGMGQTLTVGAPGTAREEYPDVRHLEFGYGGGYFAYHFWPSYVVHPVASLLVGAGGLTLSNRHDHDREEGDEFETETNGVFVLEPEAGVEVNLVSFMRLQGTLSYRRTVGVDLPGLDDSDTSNFAAGVSVLFGEL